ncbi:hypothetical protein [Desertivirga arenae]|uniref:hypothetical protein n=1 Tax=Desertivirga arenae TaxID=2810309 RepID=UPI001A9564DD|nr:hypothetical protein [Pedobacter sp. SYSU D00823]
MRTFNIIITSLTVQFLTYIILLGCIFVPGVVFLPTKGNAVVSMSLPILAFAAGYFATRRTARAKTEWTMTEEGIVIHWHNQFIFHRKHHLDIKWEEISEYKFEPDRNFDQFKLKLSDGRTYKFWHNKSNDKDDFVKFITAFKSEVENRNQTFHHQITRSPSIYETKTGLILARIAGFVMVIIPFIFLENRKGNWVPLLTVYPGAIYFIAQVYMARKGKSNRDMDNGSSINDLSA